MRSERLDKVLAGQSTWSRREVRDWIKGGLVTVNGAPVRDPGQKIIQETDRVAVKGREITLRRNLYLMMDKPAGVVDLVPPELKRPGLFPAGRLDKDTTGMVIITDDGALAHRILSPKSHVPKVYLAHIDSFITNAMIQGFAQGIPVGEEGVTLPAELVALDLDLARVTLREGMYHQIKRMFASYGAKVLELRRVSMGGLVLDGTLGPGGCRELTPQELLLLQQTDPA